MEPKLSSPLLPPFYCGSLSLLMQKFAYKAFIHLSISRSNSLQEAKGEGSMSGNWGPVVVAVVLFVLCTPGLLCQLPGNKRAVEFANFQTSPISIFVHTIIFFGLVTIFVIAIGIHIYSG
ncbi:hypothetical protein REPUB_Repub10bG0009600 [Reevesia pubescens]